MDKLTVEMGSFERVIDEVQASHYVSTKLLHEMLPGLHIYRSMPGPFRELWLELVNVGESIVEGRMREKDARRREFVEGIYASKSLEIEKGIKRYELSFFIKGMMWVERRNRPKQCHRIKATRVPSPYLQKNTRKRS